MGKYSNKEKTQWVLIPPILTWLLYSFLVMNLNPYYWIIEVRIMSVATVLFLYYVFAHILFNKK